jgi:hypothetical protein
MKPLKRSIRRHHIARKKTAAKKILQQQIKDVEGGESWLHFVTDDAIGVYARTPCGCSDDCCCNPRHDAWAKGLHKLTKQERIDLYKVQEQLDEL